MEQTLKKVDSVTEQLNLKTVDLFINSQLISIAGIWEWEMNSDNVFCADVIISLPSEYVGTKGIIHPDDLGYVREKLLQFSSPEPVDIEFRMITTYSEIKKLAGKNCSQVDVNELKVSSPEKEFLDGAAKQKKFEKGYDAYHHLKSISDRSEIISKTGMWYNNATTNETFYSDNVFRMHAINPQSLNAHLNTFTSFIHPDDSAAVNEAFGKAYRDKVPVFLEYRIITPNGTQKFISQTTFWSHNYKGEMVVYGLIKDLTDTRAIEHTIEQAENDLKFNTRLLEFNEAINITGYWHINLLTSQTYYSDNYYRIHGLKPRSVPAAANIFNNYIHPDDREKVIEAFKKIRKEHIPPDVEYCIVRPDGKLRHVIQKGMLMTHGHELVMTGTIRDITAQKAAEQKLQGQQENYLMKDIAHRQNESTGGISTWVQDMHTGNSFWSDNMYDLLGYKKGVREIAYKELLGTVLPDQRKKVSDGIALVMEGQGEREIEFSILRVGEVRNVKGIFKIITIDGERFFSATIQDVTQRELLEQQLFEGMQLNQLLAQNIFDSVFITDINNKIILWNRKSEQVFKLKQDDVLNRNYFDVLPENKTDQMLIRFNNVLKGDLVSELNERINGSEFYNLSMTPLRDKENKVIGILHVRHDVTREQQLHNKLTERYNFIEKLIEETVDRIVVMDKNFNYVYWNKNAEQYYHINKEYVIGKNVLEIFPGMVNKPLYQQLKKALKGETVYIGSTKLEKWEWREDDEWSWQEEEELDTEEEGIYAETYLIPLLNERKEVTSVLWIVHDLTNEVQLQKQRTKADLEIKQSKELLQSVFDASINIISVFKSVRNNENEITDFEWVIVNKTAQSFIPGLNLIGKQYAEVFPGVKQSNVFAQYKKVVEENVIADFEEVYNYDNINCIFHFHVIKHGDGVIATAEDITERRKTEDELKQKEKLLLERDIAQKASELLLQKKDEFISIASHELKTPVTNIKMGLHILTELIAGTDSKKILEPYIKKSDKQADKLATLINELLDITLIEENKLQLKRSKFNLKETIEEIIGELDGALKNAKIKVEGEKGIEMYADRGRMQQVLTNFLINAVKYSSENKEVHIKMEKLETEIKVSISDKGIGIPVDKQDKVFDRYFRVDESSKDYSGLGLGLYITRQIVKKHGGKIGVTSTLGKGSTFWFTIPVNAI